MEDLKLEDVIRQYVHLPPHPNQNGWYSILCKVCNDHGRKGPRAAFKFDDDKVAYHCFNCGPDMNTVYDPEKHDHMPERMVRVLTDFGIPDDEWKQVLFSTLSRKNQGVTSSENSKEGKRIHIDIEPKEIELPDHFYPLDSADENDKWALIARDYLEFTRGVDPDSYPFYLSTGGDDKEAGKWKGRLIIPFYKDNKLIFYQGRALVKMTKKYLSPSIPKEKVLYGFDQLFVNPDLPLYVVEGWFDAQAIDGVATIGNELTDAQIRWLKRSPREKVIIPDRYGSGHVMAEQALDLGWKVSVPDVGTCKDMSDAVKRFGKMYTIKSIIDNTVDGLQARMALEVYCKHGQDSNQKKGKETH